MKTDIGRRSLLHIIISNPVCSVLGLTQMIKRKSLLLCREGARFDKPMKVCYPEFSQNNKHRGANSG